MGNLGDDIYELEFDKLDFTCIMVGWSQSMPIIITFVNNIYIFMRKHDDMNELDFTCIMALLGILTLWVCLVVVIDRNS